MELVTTLDRKELEEYRTILKTMFKLSVITYSVPTKFQTMVYSIVKTSGMYKLKDLGIFDTLELGHREGINWCIDYLIKQGQDVC